MRFEELSVAEIMMMPDEVFGSRNLSVVQFSGGTGWRWEYSPIALPEHCVIWELFYYTYLIVDDATYFFFRLGSYDPAAWQEFVAMRNFPDGWCDQRAAGQGAVAHSNNVHHRVQFRKYVHAAGDHFIAGTYQYTAYGYRNVAGIVWSGFPTGEVPQRLL